MFNKIYRYASIIIFTTTLSLSLFLFGCGGGGGGGTEEATYTVTGKVVDNNGNGIPGVKVSISSSSAKLAKAVASTAGKTTTTDAGGIYTFQVPNGTYAISSADSKYGFAPISVTVNGKPEPVVQVATYPVFTVTGKITSTDGTPTAGLTVNLYKASFAIYSGTMYNGTYGTRNATSGAESVKIDSVVQSVATNNQGIYSFASVSRGSYTIQPASSDAYLFKWSLEPSRSDTGVVSITDSGMVYLYNPEESEFAKNKLSADGTIIYNAAEPFSIADGATNKLDFEASTGSGGIRIQF